MFFVFFSGFRRSSFWVEFWNFEYAADLCALRFDWPIAQREIDVASKNLQMLQMPSKSCMNLEIIFVGKGRLLPKKGIIENWDF